MAYAVWHGLAADESSSDLVVLASPDVTVTDRSDGSTPQVYADRDGNTALGNPFTANADGSITFYADPGRYKIDATDGTSTVTWDDVLIAAGINGDEVLDESDLATTAEHEAGTATDKVATPAGVHAAFEQYGLGGDAVGDGGVGTTLNDLNSPTYGDGVTAFYVTEGGVTANQPIDQNGMVLHAARQGRPTQYWASYIALRKFTRHKGSSGWTAWVEDLTASDKTGADAGIVSGTAGTSGNLAQWNADGDAVDSGVAASSVSAAAKIATGTYTGDGATSQSITGVGFQPKYLKIIQRRTSGGSGTNIHETWSSIVDDNASGMSFVHSFGGGHDSDADAIVSLDSDGFTISDGGSDSHPNTNGITYNYMAIG